MKSNKIVYFLMISLLFLSSCKENQNSDSTPISSDSTNISENEEISSEETLKDLYN